MAGYPRYKPYVPHGVQQLLAAANVDPAGKDVVVGSLEHRQETGCKPLDAEGRRWEHDGLRLIFANCQYGGEDLRGGHRRRGRRRSRADRRGDDHGGNPISTLA